LTFAAFQVFRHVQRLVSVATQTNRLEAIYQQKIKNLEEFKKSILHKAFSGELTSQIALS
jgi:type I restriction enzyme S subunit